MTTLPCTLSGRGEYKGVIRFESEGLVIEFNKWSWQTLGNQVQDTLIMYEDVARVMYKRGVFGGRIDIQLRSIKGFETFMFNSERPAGLVRLKFARKDRDEAERLASRFSLGLSEYLLEQSNNATDEL